MDVEANYLVAHKKDPTAEATGPEPTGSKTPDL
jgi:hypothetical protein